MEIKKHLGRNEMTWTPEELEACFNCRFGMPIGHALRGHEGECELPCVECHLRAPVKGHEDFPIMDGADWCGCFKRNGRQWSWEQNASLPPWKQARRERNAQKGTAE